MKRSELTLNLLSILVDWLMLVLAGIGAFYLRFRIDEYRPVLYQMTLPEYLKVLLMISPAIILLLAFAGLYNLKGTRRFSSEFFKITTAVSAALLFIVVLFFFDQVAFPSRLIVLFTWLLTIALITFGRTILRFVQVALMRRGIGLHRLAVIQPIGATLKLVTEIESRRELGYRVVVQLDSSASAEEIVANLEKAQASTGIDELLQADTNLDPAVSMKILRFCRDYGIKFNFVPNIFETSTTNVAVEAISGVPIIVLKGTPLEGWGRVAKRVLDVIASSFALIILSPLFLLTALAIKLNSRGPVFFHQLRAAGLGEFECYKFRSMYSDLSEGTPRGDKIRAELEKHNARQGPYVKIKNDPRVTPVGRFIRKTKIDELPQLWHILRGQMSLVGPRVHMVKEVDHFRSDYKRLFVLKPGATGLTQILQATEKPEISWEEEIKLDEFYIENWSIWLDIKIIFKTVLILLGRRPTGDY